MYKTLLIIHFIGLAAGLGTSMFMSVLGMTMRGASGMEQGMVNLRAFKAAMLGEIGLTLLILSGLGLVGLNHGYLQAPLFWSKMVVVAVLAIFLFLLRRTGGRISRGELDLAKRMPVLGGIVLLLGLTAMVLAVLAFEA